MKPLPTRVEPVLTPLPDLQVVLFDIYGTLLISAAGEIDPDPALSEAIAREHALSPHPFPEVEIRDIHAKLHPGLALEQIEQLAIEEEALTNPVAIMPEAAETLHDLKNRGLALGLISNAQFYTIPALEACLGGSLEDFGIDSNLSRYSYLERRAKPDRFLFEAVRDTLLEREIQPDQVIYVGNDVRNDIVPASAAGFKTALFAGDARSLRLRGFCPESCGADVVITQLGQLLDLVRRT